MTGYSYPQLSLSSRQSDVKVLITLTANVTGLLLGTREPSWIKLNLMRNLDSRDEPTVFSWEITFTQNIRFDYWHTCRLTRGKVPDRDATIVKKYHDSMMVIWCGTVYTQSISNTPKKELWLICIKIKKRKSAWLIRSSSVFTIHDEWFIQFHSRPLLAIPGWRFFKWKVDINVVESVQLLLS